MSLLLLWFVLLPDVVHGCCLFVVVCLLQCCLFVVVAVCLLFVCCLFVVVVVVVHGCCLFVVVAVCLFVTMLLVVCYNVACCLFVVVCLLLLLCYNVLYGLFCIACCCLSVVCCCCFVTMFCMACCLFSMFVCSTNCWSWLLFVTIVACCSKSLKRPKTRLLFVVVLLLFGCQLQSCLFVIDSHFWQPCCLFSIFVCSTTCWLWLLFVTNVFCGRCFYMRCVFSAVVYGRFFTCCLSFVVVIVVVVVVVVVTLVFCRGLLQLCAVVCHSCFLNNNRVQMSPWNQKRTTINNH